MASRILICSVPVARCRLGPSTSHTVRKLTSLQSLAVCRNFFSVSRSVVGSISRTVLDRRQDVGVQKVTCLSPISVSKFILRREFRSSSLVAVDKQESKLDLPTHQKLRLPYTPHEQIYNLPNFLTFARILATPVLGYFILHDQHIPAIALLVTAGITDVLDGWIARKWNLQTVVGSVVDPMADKLLVTVLTITLAMKGLLPVWLAVIILGRDVGLAISAIYYRYISLPPPKTFMRYWDFSLPSAEVRPTTISKINTLLQLGLITASTVVPVVPINEVAMVAAQYTVAVTTVWSGLSYVFSKNAVKILKQPAEIGEKDKDDKGDQNSKPDLKL